MQTTTKMYTTATKARAAVRRLRKFGILSKWDGEEKALVVFVTKHGEETTRKIVYRALETPCQI